MSFVTSDQSGSFTRVANYAALPPASSVPDVVYLTEASQGTFLLGTRKKAGLWRSNGSIWTPPDDLIVSTGTADGFATKLTLRTLLA